MSKLECHMKESSKLYRIGMFAQINRITIKALRYYDEVGLLKPEKVDEENGYRYYASFQLPRLHKILSLKEMGFRIDEIKQVLEGVEERALLMKKKRECLFEMANVTKKIAMIDSYLSGSYLRDDHQIILKSLPAVKIAYKHVTLSSYADLFEEMPTMGAEMEEAGCTCAEPEYCFNSYYDEAYKEENIEVDLCEAVTELLPDYKDLRFKELPAIECAACVLHIGPYTTLPNTYRALVSFIEENGYELVAGARESYIDGIWNKDREEDWLTEIQFPVKKCR